jgi:patatin-related protein
VTAETATAAATPTTEPGDVGTRELRLALVLYGGVSLAIYMHGITKEIHKLVKASTALDAFPEKGNPFPSGTERVYYDLLARIARGEVGHGARGTRIRVVVDVISGTSAGGINGVFLAKALARNRSLESLKALWFDKGDIKQLLKGWTWAPIGLRVALMLRRPLHLEPPLRGREMCQWLHEALHAMEKEKDDLEGCSSLMPQDHELQLFVPITDFAGYTREVPLYDPRFFSDRSHRHVMAFHHPSGADEVNGLGEGADHWLAFAARATSSFPGAFPPVSFADYERAVGGTPGLAPQARKLFPFHDGAHGDPAQTWFIDGGVLDNAPFGSSIEALSGKPAGSEVDRRLIFIQPDPGEKEATVLDKAPGLTTTVFGGYAGIPRKEPILDEIVRLGERNEAVLRIRDVIEDRFPSIEHRVTELLDELGAADVVVGEASGERLAELRKKIEARALEEAGFGAATYLRQRVRSMVDGYSAALCDMLELPRGSSKASFVLTALRRWAAEDGLLAQKADPRTQARQLEFLSTLDLAYHQRRVAFLIAALSWLYDHVGDDGVPDRATLDEGKGRLYAHIAALNGVVTHLAREPGTRDRVAAIFTNDELGRTNPQDEWEVGAFVQRHMEALVALRDEVSRQVAEALPHLEAGLYGDFLWFYGRCGGALRTALVTRYLGFPFWDVLVFPLQALTGLGERDHVEVYRMSPKDVKLLPGADLSGMSIFHFGAFFKPPGRQSDYLWGRLHAVERLVKVLLDLRPEPSTLATGGPAASPPRVPLDVLARECVPAFRAVLAEEAPVLDKVRNVVTDLKAKVEELAREGPPRDAASDGAAAGGG